MKHKHSQTDRHTHEATRKKRWLKYGSNVALLIVAALALVVFVNWIAYRHFERFDFTETRRYSLSAQTVKLINHLQQPTTITTLYSARTLTPEVMQDVRDLLAQYERRSARITVRQIDPTVDVAAYERFVDQLLDQYDQAISSFQEAVDAVNQTFGKLRNFAAEQLQEIKAARQQLENVPPATQQLLNTLSVVYTSIDREISQYQKVIEQATSAPLPNISRVRDTVLPYLQRIQAGVLKPAVKSFRRIANAQKTPAALKNFVLSQIQAYQSIIDRVSQTVRKLETLEATQYQQLRQKLTRANSMVITTRSPDGSDAQDKQEQGTREDQVIVLTLAQVYDVPRQNQPGRQPSRRFTGEEAVTGALATLVLEHQPKVVFVTSRSQPLRTSYSNVTQRLRNMNFAVTHWDPSGGRRGGGEPKPEAKPGQPMVFVFVPPPTPMSPSPMAATGRQAIVNALKQHLQAGKSALIFIPLSPLTPYGQSGQIADLLEPYGLSPKSNRLILRSMTRPSGRTIAINQIPIDDWPTGHPINRAVQGLQGVLLQGVPLDPDENPPEGVEISPLIRTPPSTWADTNFMDVRQAEREPSDPTGPFVVGAAIEKGDQRLVVIGDRAWATDSVTTFGQPAIVNGRLVIYNLYPANAELFLNSVYWLAGIEELIATTPQAQDIRRIGAITRSSQIALWWIVLAGIPALCLGAGGVVWFVRRK